MKIYHYTDSDSVKAILESGKMWLSDIRYLNDHSEYKDGEKVIRDTFQEKSIELSDDNASEMLTHLESYFNNSKDGYTFIGSFSQGEDLLSQWRGYCPKSGGYALEFEIENIKSFTTPLHECLYDDENKKLQAGRLFDLAIKVIVNKNGNKSRFFTTTWSNIAKFKNSGFSEEKEIRAIIFKKKNENHVQFRTRENLLIPYIEIEIPYDKLTAIWVGPCQQPELAQESLSRFIEHLSKNSDHPFSEYLPEVKTSKITYRG